MKAQTQRRLRQYHNWLGLFFAPAIIFFALSGTMQMLGFQDRAPGYQPPGWISLIANVHKHGMVQRPGKPRAAPSPAPKATPAPEKKPAETGHDDHEEAGLGLFKLFATILGLLLATASVLGIFIAYASKAARRTTTMLLLAGTLVPVVLLMI
ncbi:MAG: PepSY domain-containing protein [Sphingomonas sp.]|jgi:hypothetical protein